MTGWMTPDQLRLQVQKDWDRGRLPVAYWTNQDGVIPYRVGLRGPTSAQWSDKFAEARQWIATWEGFPVEWREFNHPQLGRNSVPEAVVFSTWDALLGLIGKKSAADRFCQEADALTGAFPELRIWVLGHPAAVLDHHDWPRLLAVLGWMRDHPQPGIHLRQMDLPGVHTKFVEEHRGLLSQLLDLVLPPESYDAGKSRGSGFAERYGFQTKPRLVRFRHLDPATVGPRDITWRLDDWARWDSPPPRVFITENEVNFLTFPDLPESLVVFGAGYGFEGWEQARWLREGDTHYWGDVDTHGFAILDQLRARVPSVKSLLMNQETLLHHRGLWGREPDPVNHPLAHLTEDEVAVYDGLRSHRWAQNLRLEQERISFAWVTKLVKDLGGPTHR